jgi:ribosomal protein S18 acetylase RimI-like enzyme
MPAHVIQGCFPAGRPRQPAKPPVAQLKAVRPKASPHRVGPPAPAFASKPPVVQAHGAHDAFGVDPGRLGLATGGGRLLPDAVRGKMEAALGADFSAVRVHVGPQPERIGAIAFTMGSDIYFAPGRFQPETLQGQQLLGHELAHVVQQRAGRVHNPLGNGVAVVQDRALEAEAERMGLMAAAHRVTTRANLAQPSAPVRISPRTSAAPGSFRLTAAAGGRQVGSVMVHTGGRATAEVTDLGVEPAYREQGIGKLLLAEAALTGLQCGKSKVTLAAQDNGCGKLTRWYKGMGFVQIGRNQRGFANLEAPVARVVSNVAQRREAARHVIGRPIQKMEQQAGVRTPTQDDEVALALRTVHNFLDKVGYGGALPTPQDITFVSELGLKGLLLKEQSGPAGSGRAEAMTTPRDPRHIYVDKNFHSTFTIVHEILHFISEKNLERYLWKVAVTDALAEAMTEYITLAIFGLHKQFVRVDKERNRIYGFGVTALQKVVLKRPETYQKILKCYFTCDQENMAIISKEFAKEYEKLLGQPSQE